MLSPVLQSNWLCPYTFEHVASAVAGLTRQGIGVAKPAHDILAGFRFRVSRAI